MKPHNYGNPNWSPISELKAPRKNWVGGYDPLAVVRTPFGFVRTENNYDNFDPRIHEIKLVSIDLDSFAESDPED